MRASGRGRRRITTGTAPGFDPGGVDGRMGPKTVAAIKAFQKARGLVPDGYPSLDVLNLLR